MTNEDSEKASTPHSLITEDSVIKSLHSDKGNDAKLTSYKVKDFTKKGDNYASFVSSVEVKYSLRGQDLEVVYITKLNPNNFPGFESLTHHMFNKEARFYLELLPELDSVMEGAGLKPLRFPKCFCKVLESPKEQVYLEDLRPRGFIMFDKKKGMDEAHAILMLKELARLHASSLLLEDKLKEPVEVKYDFVLGDWITFSPDGGEPLMKSISETYITNSVELLQKIGGYEKAITWAEKLKPQLNDLLKNGLKGGKFDVVCHGDCWNNNVLFRYDDAGKPDEMMLIDIQVCRKASLATDLNYFMYSSLDGNVRKSNLKSFLSHYYDAFKVVMDAGGLEMPFSEEELLQEFRAKNNLGAYYGMFLLPVVMMESDDVPDLEANTPEEIESLMEEFKTKALAMVDKNPMFKPRFLSIFDEFMETGLIS